MRTGTAYLENAAPVVTVSLFNISGAQVGNTYTNNGTHKRVVHVHTKEEPYTGHATIRLLNHDSALNALDFRGCLTAITWGWSGGTASTDQPFWVLNQRDISLEGKVLVELVLLSAWGMLEFSRGVNAAVAADPTSPTYGSTRVWERDTTVLNIITEIIQAVGGFLEQWNLDTVTTITAEPAGSGAIQTYQPLFLSRLNNSDLELLRRLLQMTNSAITFRATTGTTLNYIAPTTPGPYYTYELLSLNHPFFVEIRGESTTIPNRIIYVDQEPNVEKGEVATYVGIAELATFPLGKFGEIFIDPTIGSDAEAVIKANAHLARLIKETQLGELFVPMNCVAELYDEIQIIDSRLGATHTGRIGQIERTYQALANDLDKPTNQRDTYTTRIKLGGMGGGSTRIENPAAGINDVDTTISDFKTRSTSNPFIDTPQFNSSVLSQHLAPIVFEEPTTGNTDLTDGTKTDLTGCSITITLKKPGVLLLNVHGSVQPLTAPVVGDTILIRVNVDTVDRVDTVGFVASSTSTAAIYLLSRPFLISLAAGAHTIKLNGQRVTGAGQWRIYGTTGQTTMVGVVYSDKNAVGDT